MVAATPLPQVLTARASGQAGALERLVGRSRAAVLLALDDPASTTQLTSLLGRSLGSLGGHLAMLRDCRLVTASRSGRSVLYRRTPAGDALVAAARGQLPPGVS